MQASLQGFWVASAEFSTERRTGFFQLTANGKETSTVTVTRRGLLNAESPPRATADRFFENLGLFCEIALERSLGGELGKPISVTAEDVRRWRRRFRHANVPLASVGTRPSVLAGMSPPRENLVACAGSNAVPVDLIDCGNSAQLQESGSKWVRSALGIG